MRDPQPSGAFLWTQEPWGRALRCTCLGTAHLFTSRDVTLRDDAAEWAAVARSLDVPTDRLLLIRQVHGTRVAVARRGKTATGIRAEADIILTNDPDVAIGVRVADCAPILLWDGQRRVAGAVHAGWRGTAANAAGAAVRAMQREFDSATEDIVAAVGPSLGACCGEVGPDVVEVFRAGGAGDRDVARWFAPGRDDRFMLDLPLANRDQLVRAGVRSNAIFTSDLCTKTNRDRLHSYRADGAAAGRLLAAIRINGAPAMSDR